MGEPYKVDRELDEAQSRYEYIAHQIDREDGLVNYRLTWTLQINGFLFAALALIGSEMDDRVEALLLWTLPIAGMTISFAGVLGIVAANWAIWDLKTQWRDNPDSRWPQPFGGTAAFWLGLVPSGLPPAILCLLWIYLLVQLGGVAYDPVGAQQASPPVSEAKTLLGLGNRKTHVTLQVEGNTYKFSIEHASED